MGILFRSVFNRMGSSYRFLPALGVVVATALVASSALCDTITLRDGRQVEGNFTYLNTMVEGKGAAPPPPTKLVVMANDGLRRSYFAKNQVAGANPAPPAAVQLEEFDVPQPVAQAGQRIGGVGGIIQITPWDVPPSPPGMGRRIFSMTGGPLGRLDVIQGITKITPVWCSVQALQGKTQSYVWEMRVATSSIPRETLAAILKRLVDPKNVDQRVKVVKLFIQQERFADAEKELEAILAEFPDNDHLKDVAKELKQSAALKVLKEIETRTKAGQHQLAYSWLENFPSKGVSGQILQQVSAKLDDYNEKKKQGETIVNELAGFAAAVQDPTLRARLEPLVEEIKREMRLGTLDRMATYSRFAGDANTKPENKLSLAISGWLMGANDARENITSTIELAEVRNSIIEYMRAEDAVKRSEVLAKIKKQEFASPPLIAAILSKMAPALKLPEAKQPGYYELSVPSVSGETDVTYYVQLPPEYDPHASYPCVLTLHGASSTPEVQIEWWAGAAPQAQNGMRMGQASRHGYIVIAPAWGKPHQKEFESSSREHHAVLSVLRDACRHFAIDTDRVFLSGHSMGATAAWEIGLAHPDLWAGVIPIGPTANNMIQRYWKNAELVPQYFVVGERDGDTASKNVPEFERYINRAAGFDAIAVQFLGRGHEHFSDEIINIFDWMNRRRRNFFPREFTVVTQRETDSFFWWVELQSFEPPPRPMQIISKLTASNGVSVQCGTKVTVLLSPEIVDFSRPISVTVNSKRLGSKTQPDIGVILEDARSRGERKHPFWAKVE